MLAQLARAPRLHRGGHRFESYTTHHTAIQSNSFVLKIAIFDKIFNKIIGGFMMWIPLAVIVVLALYVLSMYNSLVRYKVRVQEAFSDITVQMKRRLDLVPNLIETVKGYAKHEKEVLESVTKARTALMQATDKGDVGASLEANNALSSTLKTLFAVSEAYPQLQANTNFLELQRELVDTEDKIQASRRFYNANVREYNTNIALFPKSILAGIFSFKEYTFYEVGADEKEAVEKPVEVKF